MMAEDDDDNGHGGFYVSSKKIYDEIVAVRVLVSPLPAQVQDHEKRLRDVESGKLSVSDYRMERAETDTKFQAIDKRTRLLESASMRFAGAKGLVAWVGGCSGAVLIAHFLNH